ncbi:hypothetical protein [Nocardioides okcheonensis]|uniref:hypothetical protein n=1 Tax=Nocardioides okcheonensis TaxID=2894081 RepID=UPI001E497E38|nr:hypothetical protein [Nocardioides okcheonensis]UFN45200.1 hypothetical protein LN652_03010 [Nocardioides okcheonensis]
MEELLGLEDGGELLEVARTRWDDWCVGDERLLVVGGFDQLRAWLRHADYDAIDDVLLALAELAALDGGNDNVAAGVLAKCLLPGACQLAARLQRRQRCQPFHDHQPVGGLRSAGAVDELVASQLWIEVRTVRWRRIRRVAANVLLDTRAAVLLELGDHFQVERRDRSWARTMVIGEQDAFEAAAETSSRIAGTTAPDASEADTTARSEVTELLAWAGTSEVITPSEETLLAAVLQAAAEVETRNVRRGCGGLLSNEVSRRVAAQMGVSESTVRRRTSRTVQALAAAAPKFTEVLSDAC